MTDRPDQPAPKRKRGRAATPPSHIALAPASVGQGAQMDAAAATPSKRRSSGKRKARPVQPPAAETIDALGDVAAAAASDAVPSAPDLPVDAAHISAETAVADETTIDAAPSACPTHTPDIGEMASLAAEDRASVVAAEPLSSALPAVESAAFESLPADAVTASLPFADDALIDDRAGLADSDLSEATWASGHADFDAAGIEATGVARAAAEDAGSQGVAPEDAASEQPVADEDARGDPPTAPPTAPPSEPPHEPPHDPHHHHGWVYLAMAVFALALLFGAWGVWTTWIAGDDGDIQDVASLSKATERLRQEVSTLRRSDQISRDANRDLQRTLAERDEEIAGLRADVAFYESFVGATGQRRGLSVHDLEMQLQSGEAWHFVATLTQNLNRGAVNAGRLTLSVEGTRSDRLERLPWTRLRQQNNAPGTPYSFKYFQQLEGDVILPKDFKPVRVIVRLVPAGGNAVEQSFTWADTLNHSPVR